MIYIEDGSGDLIGTGTLPNSYATVAEMYSFAESRGTDLDAIAATLNKDPDELAEQSLIRASDFLKSKETSFAGSRTYTDQILPFPRQDLVIYNDDVAKDSIPWQLKEAQILIAIEYFKGNDLMPTVFGSAVSGVVKKEKVGPLETEYFTPTALDADFISTPYIDALLSSLYGTIDFSLKIRRG